MGHKLLGVGSGIQEGQVKDCPCKTDPGYHVSFRTGRYVRCGKCKQDCCKQLTRAEEKAQLVLRISELSHSMGKWEERCRTTAGLLRRLLAAYEADAGDADDPRTADLIEDCRREVLKT